MVRVFISCNSMLRANTKLIIRKSEVWVYKLQYNQGGVSKQYGGDANPAITIAV